MSPAVQLALRPIETKDRPLVNWPVTPCAKHLDRWAEGVVEEAGVGVPYCKTCMRERR